jgi:2-polyprenyl-6-methoxyphenol hydroxylase-like FAD-dependent oxidoreductase
MLALLLARAGVDVVLLEGHEDFEREFRGDTIHPSAMELLDELGLADRLLELPHTKAPTLTVSFGGDSAVLGDAGPAEGVVLADFRRLPTRFPYITLLPQARFLEFLTAEAAHYPSFRLEMGARVNDLLEDGVVQGVGYRRGSGRHELGALLTVAADGRASTVRRLAGPGFEPVRTSPPMDVLWFRLPRRPGDPEQTMGRFGPGHVLAMLYRGDHWQVGYIIRKGGYQRLRAEGLEALRRSVAELAPMFADRMGQLSDWKQVSLLSVESSRLRRWYKPGLLFIGDAAHVMSPVGGVGINYAIQDAVAAANLLVEPLRAGRLSLRDLARVQREREWPTRVIQLFQTIIQRRVLARVLTGPPPETIPRTLKLLSRTPGLRDLAPRLIAFGVHRPHLSPALR